MIDSDKESKYLPNRVGKSSYSKAICLAASSEMSHHFMESDKVRCRVHNSLPFQHFNIQLTHTTLKNVELLKHFKISKTAPTCFGLQGNHHQGATIST